MRLHEQRVFISQLTPEKEEEGKVFLLKQCQQMDPWYSHTLFPYYCLPLSDGQKWNFAGLIQENKLPPSRGISLNTLQLLHKGLWASLPILFLKGDRNLLLQDWKSTAEENMEKSEKSFSSFN